MRAILSLNNFDTKKITLLAGICVAILVVFLSQSRVPDLDRKANMGLRADISALAFDTIFDVSEQAPFVERVFKSTVNWSYTNWKGMTFGILFGATVLTLFRALPIWYSRQNGFMAALQGLVGGAPLGVCVNCATPIAQGLQRAGVRLETALAVMSASPTLNFIVITMMLALFDWYFVVTKLVITVLYVVVLVPLIVMAASRFGAIRQIDTSLAETPWADNSEFHRSWVRTTTTTSRELGLNLLFLLRITLPLMILAGFLGALLVETVPLEVMASLQPTPLNYLLIALFATLLPVPIAFDVILTSSLIAIGLPVGLAMTLFFALSIYSIFPAMILARDTSWHLSVLVFVAVVVVSCLAGMLTQTLHERKLGADLALIETGFGVGVWQRELAAAIELCGVHDAPEACQNGLRQEVFSRMDLDKCASLSGDALPMLKSVCLVLQEDPSLVTAMPIESENQAGEVPEIVLAPPAVTRAMNWTELPGVVPGITIERRGDEARGSDSRVFKLIRGEDIGITRSWRINSTDLFDPYLYGKGLSTGDINQDGFPDLAVGMEHGAYIYINLGNGKYALSDIVAPPGEFNAFVVAFVDLNNDGWMDLFMSGYGGRRIIALNESGRITLNGFTELPKPMAPLTLAAGFADLDQDGDLDMALGNWSHGTERNFRSQHAANELWINDGQSMREIPLFQEEPEGLTLTLLLSDIDADGHVDVIVGNDRHAPDTFYMGQGGLEFKSLKPGGLIPETSLNTMSYDSGDFNNDLMVDLYSSEMFASEDGNIDYCALLESPKDAQKCEVLIKVANDLKHRKVAICFDLPVDELTDCMTAMTLRIAIRERLSGLCERLADYPTKVEYCERTTSEIPRNAPIDFDEYPKQFWSNKLLLAGEKQFSDVTEAFGVGRSNWAWTARAVDLDNDRFQDIFISTGYGFLGDPHNFFVKQAANVMFLNEGGKSFRSVAAEVGLADYTNTSAYSLTDFDTDGDMDIITYSQMAGIRVYENQIATASVTFVLKDMLANRDCIGCKIIITGASGRQLREIKASGGFLSFDEPIALFGMADDQEVLDVEIQWSTGEITRIEKPLPVNNRYRITRNQPAPRF